MTITLTKEELNSYQGKLAYWHVKQLAYVLDKIPHVIPNEVKDFMMMFEKNNPKPDWKSLFQE